MSPVIIEFEKGGAINTNITETKYGIYSLANLGYSSVQCQSVGLNMEKVVLTCPYGNITGIADMDLDNPDLKYKPPPEVVGPAFGLNPAKPGNKFKDACRRQSSFEGSDEFSNQACSEELNQEVIKAMFEEGGDCYRKNSC